MTVPRQREIIGTPVSITDYQEVLELIDDAVASGERTYVCCAPASTLMFARRDPILANALNRAGVVTPDGMGVVHAARLLGEELPGRVYGPDLMLMQLERAAAAGTATYLYGGYDEAALAALKLALSERFPQLRIVGGQSPPHHQLSEVELKATLSAIDASGAQIVWVGLGSPKQEIWMHRARGDLAAPVLIGVGAAFDFLAGRSAQAPRWMRDRGLEWLYRLTREPVRIGRRYLATLPHFACLVMRQRIGRD